MKAVRSLIEILGWKRLCDIAQSQGLSALCLDSIQQDKGLYESIISSLAEKNRMLKMLGASVQLESLYIKYEDAVKELSSFAMGCGLRMVILKGYGLSLNYPVPAHRPCGDIDVYVVPEPGDFRDCGYKLLDKAVSQNLGINVDVSSVHHSRFIYKGFMVENHRTIIDPDSHQENEAINKLLASEVIDGIREVNGVLLPSVRFNSIHLLVHMAGDFASVGTNLRKLLDWVTFVESSAAAGDAIEWDLVFETAESFGMLPFLNSINDICVRYMGCAPDLFPTRIKSNSEDAFSKVSDRVFNELIKTPDPILHPSQTNIIKYCWVKGCRFIQNRWKHKMVYQESTWKSLVRLARRTIKAKV